MGRHRESGRGAGRGRAPDRTELRTQALQEAEVLQQRAERKGEASEGLALLQQAAGKYQEALQGEPAGSTEEVEQAWLGLGDVLRQAAETTLALCQSLPDQQLTPARGASASQQALTLLSQSVSAFEQARPAGAPLQQQPRSAIALQEDALTWSNLGDALMTHAERLYDSGEKPTCRWVACKQAQQQWQRQLNSTLEPVQTPLLEPYRVLLL
ncbi:hypothetical protein WJX73_008555 [Symbiochloris irregularis]|uniref:Uncharacterized protein n=1 Tax=Symbiochloris irregularis TaxID=706552 RepID=A0AAW1P2L0_9CHLO